MNSVRAKEILLIYRPNTSDEADPEVTEALREAGRDPELSAWLRQHLIYQTIVRERLHEIPVPPGLAREIIRAAEIRRSEIGRRRNISLYWLAAAATIVFGFLIWTQRHVENNFDAYRQRMVRTALREYRMDMVSEDVVRIRQYLREHSGHGDWAPLPKLERLPALGCGLLHWHDRKISVVCFNGGAEQTLFLFIAKATDLSGIPTSAIPVIRRVNKMTTASWTLDDKTYLLAAHSGEELLRNHLP